MLSTKVIDDIVRQLEKEGLNLETHSSMVQVSGVRMVMRNPINEHFYFVELSPHKFNAMEDKDLTELIDFMKAKVQE